MTRKSFMEYLGAYDAAIAAMGRQLVDGLVTKLQEEAIRGHAGEKMEGIAGEKAEG